MRLQTTWLVAAAFAIGACDNGASTSDDSVAISGFALTADDESNDGFDESADTTDLEDQVIDDLGDDSDAAPPADEVDPAPDETGRVARTVLVLWGQPRGTEGRAPTAWEGQITSDVASLHVLRTFHFERAAQGDHLTRDGDPLTVTFATKTTTVLDGVLLRVVAPRGAAVSGELTFATDHFTQSVTLASLFAGQGQRFAADDDGNIVAFAPSLPHACEHGVLRFGWHRVGPRGGVFGGKVFADDGSVAGEVVGIWGTVRGKDRFKGVFHAADGSFRGTVRGAYTKHDDGTGTFRGMWVAGGRVHGVLGGLFEVGDTRGQGSAHGFWRADCGDGAGCAMTLPPADQCVAPEAPEDPAE